MSYQYGDQQGRHNFSTPATRGEMIRPGPHSQSGQYKQFLYRYIKTILLTAPEKMKMILFLDKFGAFEVAKNRMAVNLVPHFKRILTTP